MKIVLVGEAWGRHEAQFQHPLVGPSGRELTLQLGAAGLAPYMSLSCRKCKNQTDFVTARCQHCNEYIWPNEFNLIDHWKRLRLDHQIASTNVFNEQPPSNEIGHFFGLERETPMPAWKASKKIGGSHVKAEKFHHIRRLYQELEDMDPNLIIALGNAACWALLGQTKITALRGTISRTNNILTGLDLKVIPTFHPAAVLRQPTMRVTVLADLNKARREAKFKETRRISRFLHVIDPTEAGLRTGYEWFQKPAIAYANDIETIYNQISIIGFSRAPDDGLVIVFRNEDYSNYWPTPELEFQAWKLAIHGLQTTTPKIYQNGLFDISYLLRMGIVPKNPRHDTMLWHHSEYPELPKSLGYLGSLYCDEISWKVLHNRGSLKRDE